MSLDTLNIAPPKPIIKVLAMPAQMELGLIRNMKIVYKEKCSAGKVANDSTHVQLNQWSPIQSLEVFSNELPFLILYSL